MNHDLIGFSAFAMEPDENPPNRSRPLAASLVYFGLVFAAGFALGSLRVFFVEPRIGVRAAELAEIPLMIVVIVLSARWIGPRFLSGVPARRRLAAGGLALAWLLLAEVLLGALLNRVSPLEAARNFFDRDPISGTAYYLSLGFLALMPALVRYRA